MGSINGFLVLKVYAYQGKSIEFESLRQDGGWYLGFGLSDNEGHFRALPSGLLDLESVRVEVLLEYVIRPCYPSIAG